ncbi:MAG: type II secretion system GspH family protein [Holosporales bacterium]|jgi:prepilin-type N-terminal cleavage/methylation domain-containing protein|nr:type II secretion system GspH family protein [Holosporales bacterium]
MRNHSRKNTGFSLLEVAIALMVLGVLSTVLLESTLIIQKRMQMHTTQERMEMILASLAAYTLRHSRLPAPDKSAVQDENAYIGTVPYEELGLAPYMVRDGWNQPIIYAVEESLTKTTRLMSAQGESLQEDLKQAFCNITKTSLRPSTTAEMSHVEDPSRVVAVVLYSSAGNSLCIEELFNGAVLKMDTAQKGIVRWISRDVLMAAYGHLPCQQTGGDAERPPASPSDGTRVF